MEDGPAWGRSPVGGQLGAAAVTLVERAAAEQGARSGTNSYLRGRHNKVRVRVREEEDAKDLG